ncbi:hypothetical protein HSX11_01555 [Oxalobacteraceae bacterium]|nr:hypothetical protein [Oxalobacteraceae bacterium]
MIRRVMVLARFARRTLVRRQYRHCVQRRLALQFELESLARELLAANLAEVKAQSQLARIDPDSAFK